MNYNHMKNHPLLSFHLRKLNLRSILNRAPRKIKMKNERKICLKVFKLHDSFLFNSCCQYNPLFLLSFFIHIELKQIVFMFLWCVCVRIDN